MSARTLERIKLGVSPQTGDVFIYRHGANPGIALERREAVVEMFGAFIGTMLFGLPEGQKGCAHNMRLGSKWYRVMCMEIDDPTPKPADVPQESIATTETTSNAEVPQDQELPKAD